METIVPESQEVVETPTEVQEEIIDRNTELKKEADESISLVLQVNSDAESHVSVLSPVKKSNRKKYNPKNAKTRKNLIRKLKELYTIGGMSEDNVKSLNLHRRRKASIEVCETRSKDR